MFIDYPHTNKILKDKPNFINKSLSNIAVLNKEFYVLKFLKKQSFVPKVYNLRNNNFQEERLIGREIKKNDLTDTNIKKIALVLSKLHSLKIPVSIKKIAKNNFIQNNRYQPTAIVREIIKKSPAKLDSDFKKNILKITKDFEIKLNKEKYKISLIHGDLSYHNIFLQNNKIFLIDWSDCRLDIPSCDVSQLFYLLKFNKKQKETFLKYYQSDYINTSILKFHEMLLLLYDLISISIKKRVIDKTKLEKLSLFCKKNYD